MSEMSGQSPLHIVLRQIGHRILILGQAGVFPTPVNMLGCPLLCQIALCVKDLFYMLLSLFLLQLPSCILYGRSGRRTSTSNKVVVGFVRVLER